MPTTLSQMGSVAKTQAKGQQNPTHVTPFSEQMNRDEDLRVQRVKQTEEAQQENVDPDRENPDKRKRRRLNRQRKLLEESSEEDLAPSDEVEGDSDEESLGVLIDMRV